MIKKIIQHESFSACLLLCVTLLALIMSNSSISPMYEEFTDKNIHFVNEGLMTVFFLVVGLEIKHELYHGELNTFSTALLPAIAALGGMVVPALIYFLCNFHDHANLRGWAIPMATDIAFSLGVLTLLGQRVPRELKILLMALAIFDDLAAIVVIAVFYTTNFSLLYMLLAFFCVVVLFFMYKNNHQHVINYLVAGGLLWYFLGRSGVHPTVAGVILAFFIPSFLAENLQRALHPWVVFAIVPMFAFANAGIPFVHISFADLKIAVVLGVFFGLFLGKQIGIFSFCWLCAKCRIVRLSEKLTWRDIYAMSVLCGIGFTISLFIGTLAFGDYWQYLDSVKIGVLSASLLSGLVGYWLLRRPVASIT